ncbi:LuxR C-terminal-related transcriptional regulator [Actinoplanes sp. NEAU-A12]|uniref:LuxR C-terminal-related transcriptional regulator n=1 Tax=Actinoplanes sandaracinus TaxID=3045177 RepID=A0ABT6WZV7_9ACTN|nr:LuxR C-terminal-related transcriptional regulator [Actinoplanes sandaracinus]MDI6105125.1 LuxR C-terminal-related transcriptional regulator [Actinoplanes sandaracinus]
MTTLDHEILSGLGTFIGRDELVATALQMLQDNVRWLTLHGAGGIGKTSLATQIAHSWQRIPDARSADHAQSEGRAAWIINLGALTSESKVFAGHLYSLLADAVGLRYNGKITPDVVRAYLDGLPEVNGRKPKQFLLVFDRCDDIITELRPVLDNLLAGNPELRIIATSRQRFRHDAEHVLPVPPLGQDDTVALFTALVKQSDAGAGALGNKAAVTQLCKMLEGLPLAVHLAAQWVPRVLSVEELIKELEKDLFGVLARPDLEAGDASQPSSKASEHSGLERVVAFSYEHCSKNGQQAWQRLAVFRHGFDLAAAAAVTGHSAMPLRALIAELVDKSIIRPDSSAGVTQWRMMDSLREFGLRRLGSDGVAEVRALHREHFADFTAQAADGWYGPHEIDILRDVRRQLDDILAAIDHCLDDGNVIAAGKIAFDLVRTRTPHFHGVLEMVAQVLRRVIAAFGPDQETDREAEMLATVAAALGWVVVTQGRADEAHTMAEFAKNQMIRRGLPVPADLLYPLGAIKALRDGSREAIGLLSGVLLTTPANDATAGGRHMVKMMLTMSQAFADVPEAAMATAADYLREAEESQGPWSIAWALWSSALAARRAGEYEQACEFMLPCLRLEAELHDRWGITWSVQLYAEIVALMLDTNDNPRAAAGLAAWLLGAASALRTAMGVDLNGLPPLDAGRVEARAHILRHLTAAEFAGPYEAGVRGYLDAIPVALGESTPRWSASTGVSMQTSAVPAVPSTSSHVSMQATAGAGLFGLTAKELETAQLAAEQLTNADIAARTGVGEETVKNRISNILRKLNIKTRRHIARRLAEAQRTAT